MLPPQTPSAYATHANQAAIDAVQRMGELQRWIVRQQQALPDPPERLEDRDDFLARLDAFWEAPVEHMPGTPSLPRRQAFGLRLAQAARDDAALRGNDGTLAGEALALVHAVALHPPGAPLPEHIHASELLVGEVPYAGALVLQDDRHDGRVLLFTVEAGWQTFDSLEVMYRDTEWRMRARLAQQDELPGNSPEDLEKVIETHFLDTRAIDGDVFDVLTRRLVARLRERARDAYDHDDEEVRDRLHGALALSDLLDVHAIVQHRDLALAARLEEERLARLPATVRLDWQRAAEGYRDGWREVREDALSAPPSLARFAENQLGAALTSRGVLFAPGDLYVRVTRNVPEKPISELISGVPSEDLSFSQLAYRNVTASEALSVIHADGTPRSDVSAETLRGIVRELDLPNRYASHLAAAFGDSPAGRARRATVTGLRKAAMRSDAQEARIASYHAFNDPVEHFTASDPAPFIYDRQERGVAWVNAVLDHPEPHDRKRVDGHEIVVHQLVYKGSAVADVLMIAARQRQAVRNIVLYTPGAPDGMVFREFRDRDELDRRFLLDPRFEDYLLDRLPDAFAETGPNGERRFKIARLNGDRSLDWVFNTEACQGCTETGARFEEREVATSFLDVAYDQSLALATQNAHHHARATSAADRQIVFDAIEWTRIPSLLVREFVVGTVHSVPRAAQASWRFYDKVKAGESTEAFLAFVDGYTSALNVLPLYTQMPRYAGASVRAATGSRKLVPTHHALPEPATLFEQRYLAEGVTLPPGSTPGASGVHTLDGAHYIQQGGKLYHVRYTRDFDTWRLNPPGGSATSYGPPVERLPNGQWQYRRVGLEGGGNLPGRHAYEPIPEAGTDIAANVELLNPEVAALTPHQRAVLKTTLRKALSRNKTKHTLKHMLGHEPNLARLSQAERVAWQDAVFAGRRAPRDAPIATLPPVAPVEELSLVAPVAWPDHVYAYLPAPIARHGSEVASISLQPLRVLRNLHIQGVPVTALPPTTPLASLPPELAAWLPRPVRHAGATLGSATGGWVRIDLRRLRNSPVYRPTLDPELVAHSTPFQLHAYGKRGYQYAHRPEVYLLSGGQSSDTSGVLRLFGSEFEIPASP